jgi:hypothetical protein
MLYPSELLARCGRISILRRAEFAGTAMNIYILSGMIRGR